jgi:hypothetical protein
VTLLEEDNVFDEPAPLVRDTHRDSAEAAGVLHRLGRRWGNRLAQRSRDLRPARSCGKA